MLYYNPADVEMVGSANLARNKAIYWLFSAEAKREGKMERGLYYYVYV